MPRQESLPIRIMQEWLTSMAILILSISIEFSEHVEMVEAVVLLSRPKGVAYSDYVMGIKNSVFTAGAIARVVKLADLFDHLMGPTPCPESLVGRYEKSLYMLYGAK